MRIIETPAGGEPAVREGDDLLAVVGAVGRAGTTERLRRWHERLRESGVARARVRVTLAGGRRAVLVLTGMRSTDDERHLVVLEAVDGTRPGAVAVDGELDLRTAVERLDALYYELERADDGSWANRYASPQWEAITGIPLPDDPTARSRAWLAMIHPDDAEETFARLQEGVGAQSPVVNVYRIVRPDGRTRWVRDQLVGFGGTAARPRLAGVTTDITDQLRRDEQLRGVVDGIRALLLEMDTGMPEPDRIRGVLSSLVDDIEVPRATRSGPVAAESTGPSRLSGLGVMTFRLREDARGRMAIQEPSPTLLGFLGGLPERTLRVVHPEDRRRVMGDVGRLALGAGEGRIAFRVIRDGGSAAWVRLSLRTRSRRPLDVFVTVLDITSIVDAAGAATPPAAVAAEARPDEPERDRRLDAAEGLEDVVLDFATDGDVRLRYVSPSANAILGTPGLEPPAGRAAAWMSAVHPGDLPGLLAEVRAAAGSDDPVRGAHRLRRTDGGVRWLRTVLRAAAGGGVVGVAGDITDLMSGGRLPDRNAEVLDRVVANMREGVWDLLVLDPVTRASRFTFVSRRMWEILGVPERTPGVFGEVLERAIHPGDRAATRARLASLMRGHVPHVTDHRIVRPDGEVRWVRMAATGMADEAGERRFTGTMSDITAEVETGLSPEDPADARLTSLTPRQREILDMLAAGAGTDEMAVALGIRPVTVSNHVAALLKRLGVRSRLEAVAVARGNGVPDPRPSPIRPSAQ